MAKFWSINPPIPPFVFFSVIHWITLGTITVITILIDFLVDIFGPSPGYILGLELLGMFICLMLWVPFGVLSFVGKRTEKKESQS